MSNTLNNQDLRIKEIFNLAVKNHTRNNIKVAQELYKKILKIKPDHSNALNNLGIISFNLGDNQNTINYYKKAIASDQNNSNAYNNLGVVFNILGEVHKAKNCYEKAIKINPNYADAYNNLGIIFYNSGDNQKAKDCYEAAIKIDPNNVNFLNSLINLAISMKLTDLFKNNIASYKKLFLFLFKKNNISHNNISTNGKNVLLFEYYNDKIERIIKSESLLLNNRIIQNFLMEDLLHLMLQKSIIVDNLIEKFLTKIKCEILFALDGANKNDLKRYFNFIISLSEQSWLNEYVYIQSEKEKDEIYKLKNKIEKSDQINEFEIAILGCYIPLNTSAIITKKLLNYESSSVLFNNLVNVQVKEPLREKDLKKTIKSIDKIDDLISKKVRKQYEENPYPRWRYCDKYKSIHFLNSLNNDIKPNRVKYNNKFNNPNILIAGCGTGNHLISASNYNNANILGVDLSLASLAYAKRKVEELGSKNIKFLHGDILQLKKLNKKFDIIESSGVLHHMKDPIAGLKVLTDILEPHGYLKLGLYSKTARTGITKIREFIKQKKLKNTKEDIKIFRREINDVSKNLLKQKLIYSRDFYSTSAVRDLLFHVQEHCFSLPQISNILENLNLEFLGFVFTNTKINKRFSKYFPNDKKNISLNNWNQFEIKYPNTFGNMYQFWVKKI